MAGEKILFIVRHGKSSWEFPGVNDIDRPLIAKGISDGIKMAKKLSASKMFPDLIVTSPAARALHTAIIFSRILEFPAADIIIKENLYLADLHEIMSVINATESACESLMIFGHNPGFTDLANHLSGLNIENLPTTGLVQLKFKTETWKGISKKCLTGEFFDVPQNV